MITEPLYAKVVDVTDPKKLGRIRAQIMQRTEGIDKALLPWYLPSTDHNTHNLPALNELVEVMLINDDVFVGYWRRINRSETMVELGQDDYESAKVMLKEDLSEVGDEGILQVSYLKSKGVQILYKESMFIIRPDNSIALFNKDKNWWVDVSPESISFGTETKSAEPGVLGDKNHDSLKMLNDTIKKAAEIIDQGCQNLAKLAMSNPYTSVLASGFTKIATELKAQIETQMHKQNEDYFPKTLSKVVTLD